MVEHAVKVSLPAPSAFLALFCPNGPWILLDRLLIIVYSIQYALGVGEPLPETLYGRFFSLNPRVSLNSTRL